MNVSRKVCTALVSLALLGLGACDEGATGGGTTGTAPSAAKSTTTGPSATATGSAKAEAEKPKGDVFFVQPTEGATVFPELEMAFGTKDIELGKQGYLVVVVDGEPIEEGKDVPKDDQHVAFDKGDKMGNVKLETGKHKLTLQLVSPEGKSWGKELSQTIEVEVLESEGERSVSFLEPQDGAKVKNPVKMKFDVKGMKIELAGKAPKARTTGHHHVLINHDHMDVGLPIPDDETHKHFGKGQTEVELELPKGKVKLTLQFADGSHVSYGEKMSQTITVEVE